MPIQIYYNPSCKREMRYPNPVKCLICHKNYMIFDTVIKENIPVYSFEQITMIKDYMNIKFGKDIQEIISSYLLLENMKLLNLYIIDVPGVITII